MPKNETIITDRIDGYFLTFTDDEKQHIFNMLYEEGYLTDIDGLKKWILDCAMHPEENEPGESPADRVSGSIQKLIFENPEKIVDAGIKIGEGIQHLINTMKKKGR